MYYTLNSDLSQSVVGMVDYGKVSAVNEFTIGRMYTPAKLSVHIEYVPDSGYPDFFELQQVPLVNKSFVERLQQSNVDNYQLFPVELQQSNGVIVRDYFTFNIIGRVECVDKEKSLLKMRKKRIMRIDNLVIDENKAKKLPLFRLHEYEYLILMNEQLANLLLGLNGAVIVPANGWNHSYRY